MEKSIQLFIWCLCNKRKIQKKKSFYCSERIQFIWIDISFKKKIRIQTQYSKGVKVFQNTFLTFLREREKKTEKLLPKLNCCIKSISILFYTTIKFSKSILFVSMLLVSCHCDSEPDVSHSLTLSLSFLLFVRKFKGFQQPKKKKNFAIFIYIDDGKFAIKVTRSWKNTIFKWMGHRWNVGQMMNVWCV